MSKSISLRARDVRALFRLVGECRELGDDGVAWRRHFAEQLAGLVAADSVLNGELAGCRALKNVDLGVTFWWPKGFSPPPYWIEHIGRFRDDGGHAPVMSEYHRLNRDHGGLALSRKDFVADRDWYGGYDFLKIQGPLGFDASLWCVRPLPRVAADEHNGLVLMRNAGRRDFSPRDRTLVGEAHAAIAPLIGAALARFREPGPRDLPAALRRVLACLLEGDGDKQIAGRLGLSPYTVNEYSKRIYRHFDVRSRSELLARWIRRGWGEGFSWARPEGPNEAEAAGA